MCVKFENCLYIGVFWGKIVIYSYFFWGKMVRGKRYDIILEFGKILMKMSKNIN